LALRDREGKVIGVIGAYKDITEQKRVEPELHASLEKEGATLSGALEGTKKELTSPVKP